MGASGGCKGGLEGGFLVVVMQCLLLLTGMHHSYTTHTKSLVLAGGVCGGRLGVARGI